MLSDRLRMMKKYNSKIYLLVRQSNICNYNTIFLFVFFISSFIIYHSLFLFASTEDILLVDDFNDGNSKEMKNKLGGKISAWESDPDDKSQWCNVSYEDKVCVGEYGSSLKIDYSIASNKMNFVEPKGIMSVSEMGFHGMAFNGIAVEFVNMDVSPYRYLVFSAKGDAQEGFSRRFKLELKDKERSVSYLFDKLTSRWQKFYIPLDHFSSGINIKDLRAVMIIFDQNVTRNRGVFYVDDLFFAKKRNADLYASAAPFIRHARESVKIDGDLKEWEKVKGLDLKSDAKLETGKVDNDKDISATAYLQWDEQFLYFAVQVRDNEILCLKTGENIYQSDSVELFIDPPPMDGLIWRNSADVQLGFAPSSPDGTPQDWAWFQKEKPSSGNVRYAGKIEKNGYAIEAAISWDYLIGHHAALKNDSAKMAPRAKDMIGISVAVNDLDLRDKSLQAKLNWHLVADGSVPGKFQLDSFRLMEK